MHGDLLTVLTSIEDPIYLTEPEVLSKTFQLDSAPMSPVGPPCVAGYEGVGSEVPHYLPGKNPSIGELTDLYHIPREAMLGGAETMYPGVQEEDEGRVRAAREVRAQLRRPAALTSG